MTTSVGPAGTVADVLKGQSTLTKEQQDRAVSDLFKLAIDGKLK